MRARREVLADRDVRERSAAACARLLARAELATERVAGRVVAGYLAVRGEIESGGGARAACARVARVSRCRA